MTVRRAVGIDVGTSSIKVSVIAEDGSARDARSETYPTIHPHDGWAEQDPATWWVAIGHAVRDALGAAAGRDVGGDELVVGLTGQMHTSVLADANGDLVRPAILWSDQRGAEIAGELMRRHPEIAEVAGNVLIPAFTLSHLAWLRTNEPDAFARVDSVSVPKDHIRARLGAGFATEPADASAMSLLDTRTDEWSPLLLELAGLSAAQLPPVHPSHAVTGHVTRVPDGAEALLGAAVVGGAGDQAAQAVALGVTDAGALGLSLGTSGVAFQALPAPAPQSFRHAYPGMWLALNSMHAAGLALSWWSTVTGIPVAHLAEGAGERDSGPVFLPYLQGHRGAHGAPGSLVGLDSRHDAYDIARGIMEGVAAELALLGESVGGGSGSEVVFLGGGGGRSQVWRQIVADTLGRPVAFSDRDSSFGAALIAAEGAGWAEAFRADDATAAVVTEPRAATAGIDRLARHRDAAERLDPARRLAP